MDKIWKNSKLKSPDFYKAKYENDEFIVFIDSSTILFMMHNKKKITYCIPKKYTTLVDGIYLIDEFQKMKAISCQNKTKYEKFVIKNMF